MSERLQQAEGEPYDFFAMRAFIVALDHLDDNRVRAMINYIADRGFHELIKRIQASTNAAAGAGAKTDQP